MKPLRLYLSSNLDGILVCPETVVPNTTIRVPDSRRRVFVAGNPDVRSLNHDQLNAIVELAYRDPKIREGTAKAVFYDAKVWAEQERHKIVLTHQYQYGKKDDV